uniref:Solute carrier family 25 member 38 n=1 Tax=Cacopsylla melanoneura TaxID=428564 RepID=A0A8D8YPH9_9HEMI
MDPPSPPSKAYEPGPVVQALISGSVSGTLSTFLLQPLDVIKTRLQSQCDGNKSSQGKRIGVVKITKNIIMEEKLTTLWRGLTPTLWRTVPGVSLYFSGVHLLTASSEGSPGFLQAASAGFVSRACVAFLLAPFTVVKTRYESTSFHYDSLRQALSHIFRTEGLKGLWSGTNATVVRDAPYSGLYFMFYTQAKAFKPTELSETDAAYILFQLGCGGVAGVIATLVTQPADIVKTRMQLTSQATFTSVVHSIYQDYGTLGFVQGFVPRVMKRTLMSAISWTIFEQMSRILSTEQPVR